MTLWLNDRETQAPDNCSVAALLATLGQADLKGLAVAVNDEVVPRKLWPQRLLAEGDRVLLIQATQGG